MPQQRISLDPDPPVAGKSVTICYDFSESGLTSTSLVVTFGDIPGGTHEVSKTEPCITIDVLPNSTQICVEDSGGTSPDKVAPVV